MPHVFASGLWHSVSATGPSSAAITAPTLISSAGRERRKPPPTPREDVSRPAWPRALRILLAVGRGTRVCFERSRAEWTPRERSTAMCTTSSTA